MQYESEAGGRPLKDLSASDLASPTGLGGGVSMPKPQMSKDRKST